MEVEGTAVSLMRELREDQRRDAENMTEEVRRTGRKVVIGLSVDPISLQLREHGDINLGTCSPPLSTEIANKFQ